MAKKASILSRLNFLAKAGICGFLVAVTALIYLFVFHNDIQERIETAKSKSEQLYKELEAAREAQHAYAKDLEELTDKEQGQRELSKILPKTAEAPAFLSSVQAVADVTGISLTSWTPQATVPEKYYARVPVAMKIEGTFHEIARFFYNVGQLDRIINIENIQITKPAVKGDEIILQVSAKATAFHALAAAAAGGKKGK